MLIDYPVGAARSLSFSTEKVPFDPQSTKIFFLDDYQELVMSLITINLYT